MLCLDAEVRKALIADKELIKLLNGEKVYQPNQPGEVKKKFPSVVFEEISNVPENSFDNLEKNSRITYRLLVYSNESPTAIINAVERVMIAINFVRHSSNNLHDLPVGVRGKEILFITIRECI